MTYPLPFRKKILKIKAKEELSFSEVGKRFGISKAAIFRWSKNLELKKHRNKKWSKIDVVGLKKDIEEYPDSYCYERGKRLDASGIRDPQYRLCISYKKTLNHPKANPEKRSIFCQKIADLENEEKPIVYIDASGFEHDMPKTHGYSIKRLSCYGKHDWGAKGRTNPIGALICSTIGLLTGSVDTSVFTCWAESILLPNIPTNSLIVMDNATFHKGVNMQQLIRNSGHALLYLPPYSPDLNPIEKKWSQAKQIRRSTKCTIDQLFQSNLKYHASFMSL